MPGCTKPMDNMSKNDPCTSMPLTQLANKIYVQFDGNPCIHVHETRCQSVVRSCSMPGLPRHLVQELNVGTVGASMLCLWRCGSRGCISLSSIIFENDSKSRPTLKCTRHVGKCFVRKASPYCSVVMQLFLDRVI